MPNFSCADIDWMEYALILASKAESKGEVPVGAVLVRDQKLLAEGYNRVITDSDPSAHAEVVALRNAGKAVGNYRLPGTTLYVTLEPCCMCAGAIIHSRVDRVIYAATDPKTGAAGSRFNVLNSDKHNHQPIIEGGLLADDASAQLKSFFATRRKAHK
ncbi:MAG: tRNA adenosine(34) deaminase TadA [Xanthomonadales bacterium]|nr:tRNA adenosine(34) deaminase TadA [Xanthomonadales bacterium]